MIWFMGTVVAGFFNGSFTLPMKTIKRWKWEHSWSLWSLWACLIFPWLFAFLTVPHLLAVYSAVPWGTLLPVFLFSLGWGIGAITFGLGIDYVGIALGVAIIMGTASAVGALVPLLLLGRGSFLTAKGFAILAGVMVMIVGIVICAKAGAMKEKQLREPKSSRNDPARPFMKGLLICVIAGVSGSLTNFVFVFGAPIQQIAIRGGANPTFAPNAIWCVGLLGGFLVNTIYCLSLVSRRRGWKLFAAGRTGINWFWTMLMGLAWYGSVSLYGIASSKLGSLGPAIGFSSFLGIAMVTGNLWGLLTGEWKGSGRKPVLTMAAGVLVLISAVCLIGWSSTL
jgi:L-rhamnose-H+ transport protein